MLLETLCYFCLSISVIPIFFSSMGDSKSQVLLVVAEKGRDEGLGLLSTGFFQIYQPLEEGSPRKNSRASTDSVMTSLLFSEQTKNVPSESQDQSNSRTILYFSLDLCFPLSQLLILASPANILCLICLSQRAALSLELQLAHQV